VERPGAVDPVIDGPRDDARPGADRIDGEPAGTLVFEHGDPRVQDALPRDAGALLTGFAHGIPCGQLSTSPTSSRIPATGGRTFPRPVVRL